ncbi:MAG: hypothetical protein P9L99_21505 [Candidatus Lernaella stagnicola]|nr:hypothetical protein [Candidatus Lernaella stagnicola]
MRHVALALLVFCLWLTPAFAADQNDEPDPDTGPRDQADGGDFDTAYYLTVGRAVRLYDLTRLNHNLDRGGVDPFTGVIDDWNFELAFIIPRTAHFALVGGFWDQKTGGRPVHAELRGFEIYGRWGMPLFRKDMFFLYPTFGIGYAQRVLELDGRLAALGSHDLPSRGSVDIKQRGMLFEVGFRFDLIDGSPDESRAAFLFAESFMIGWMGVPVASDWQQGDRKVSGIPDDMIHTLFAKVNIGFGVATRKAH